MQTNKAAMESVAGKLNDFASDLSEEERVVVELLVAKALDESEVEGFSFNGRDITTFNLGTPDFRQIDLNRSIGDLFCPEDDDEPLWLELIGGPGSGSMPRF